MKRAEARMVDLLARITKAVRCADRKFEQVGGSSRHWVRECLLPELEAEGLAVVDTSDTWRPIETAPRDGTEVALLFAREETGVIGARSTWPRVRAGARFAGGDWSIPYYANNPPIGWTPLPAPPAAEGGEGG